MALCQPWVRSHRHTERLPRALFIPRCCPVTVTQRHRPLRDIEHPPHLGGLLRRPWLSGAGCPTAGGPRTGWWLPVLRRRAALGTCPVSKQKLVAPTASLRSPTAPHCSGRGGLGSPRPADTRLTQALVPVEGAVAEALDVARTIWSTGSILRAWPGWWSKAEGHKPGPAP